MVDFMMFLVLQIRTPYLKINSLISEKSTSSMTSCGTGRFSFSIAENAYSFLGIDYLFGI